MRNRPLLPSLYLRRAFAGGWPLVPALLAVLALGAAGCGPDRELPPEVPRLVQATVDVKALPAEVRKEKERERAWEEMRRFYQKRAYAPAWVDGAGPLPQARQLAEAIELAAPEGLEANGYHRARLEALIAEAEKIEDAADPAAQHRLVDLDVTLTYTYLTLATHLASGRLQPETLRTAWYTKPRSVDLDAVLARALAEEGPDKLRQSLAELTPPNEVYRLLREALARYRGLAARGGWPQVPPGPKLTLGATGLRVAALRARLAAEGDLPPAAGAPDQPAPEPPAGADRPTAAGTAGDSAPFDDALGEAVARFQRRHGLDPSGVVDDDTLEALNVPIEERVRQIAINMERWRWMPNDLGRRYILVNVPEYQMRIFEGDREALTMRVVVGKTQSQTPVFSDRMTYLELNPAWNLPTSIVRDEVLPALASDSSYLQRKNMEVVRAGENGGEVVDPSGVDFASLGQNGSPYRLRQRPGPDNPLGQIKFMFPNELDVYLHDTPADHLFAKEERDFSHGCIRVERPLDLAAYLLQGEPRWTKQAIQEAVASGERRTVTLPRPLPVHILYWTAWVDQDGTVQFRKDVYGHDAKLARALAKEPPLAIDFEALRGEMRAEAAGAERRKS